MTLAEASAAYLADIEARHAQALAHIRHLAELEMQHVWRGPAAIRRATTSWQGCAAIGGTQRPTRTARSAAGGVLLRAARQRCGCEIPRHLLSLRHSSIADCIAFPRLTPCQSSV